jgi:hypothetical protein
MGAASATPASRTVLTEVHAAGITVVPTGAFAPNYVMSESWMLPGALESAVTLATKMGWDGLAIDNEEWFVV